MSKGLTHEIIADIKKVAHTMGRTPSRNQYVIQGNFGKHQIDEVFGNWTNAIRAAGMSTKGNGKLKVDKQEVRQKVFEKVLSDSDARKSAQPPKIVRNGIVFPDKHAPYHHKDFEAFVRAYVAKYGPFDAVADVGDGEDFHAMSFHDSDPDLLSPGHELRAAIEANKFLYELFPVMEIAESNHSSMVYRKGLHHGFPRHVLKSYREVLEAPEGWTWKPEIIWQLPNGQKVLICHSYGNVLQVSKKRGMSVVQGHHHSKSSIEYWSPCSGTVHFAAQTGSLVDDTSLALAYNKVIVERPILSILRITNGYPQLTIMPTDSSGRWTGVVP